MVEFCRNIHIPYFFLEFYAYNVKKAFENALSLLKDHLELFLRPIQAPQMTNGPFWTKQKRLEAFCTSNLKFVSPRLWNSCESLVSVTKGKQSIATFTHGCEDVLFIKISLLLKTLIWKKLKKHFPLFKVDSKNHKFNLEYLYCVAHWIFFFSLLRRFWSC